jgi:hypothetical protein
VDVAETVGIGDHEFDVVAAFEQGRVPGGMGVGAAQDGDAEG